MTDSVTITTGARLHFGLSAGDAAAGPSFGGVGMMIDRPRYRLTLRRQSDRRQGNPERGGRSQVVGSSEPDRVLGILARLRERTEPGGGVLPPVIIEVAEEIPQHVGFGSGTQLALALARAAAALMGGPPVAATELARRVGRGRRSAIGIHGFEHGGFLVDGGKPTPDAIGTLAARCDFPVAWRWVLITRRGRTGLHSGAERDAFRRLPPMSAATSDRLHGIAVGELLPAVREADFEAFSTALFEYGRIVGEHFAPVQGGTFADPAIARLVDELRREGVRGIAQTSWGPTACVVCRHLTEAENLVGVVSSRIKARIQIASSMNSPAQSTILAQEPAGRTPRR